MLVPQTKPDNIRDFSDIPVDIHQDIYLHIYWDILKTQERTKEQCLLYPLFIPTTNDVSDHHMVWFVSL